MDTRRKKYHLRPLGRKMVLDLGTIWLLAWPAGVFMRFRRYCASQMPSTLDLEKGRIQRPCDLVREKRRNESR
jgi:hypothetical protein